MFCLEPVSERRLEFLILLWQQAEEIPITPEARPIAFPEMRIPAFQTWPLSTGNLWQLKYAKQCGKLLSSSTRIESRQTALHHKQPHDAAKEGESDSEIA